MDALYAHIARQESQAAPRIGLQVVLTLMAHGLDRDDIDQMNSDQMLMMLEAIAELGDLNAERLLTLQGIPVPDLLPVIKKS